MRNKLHDFDRESVLRQVILQQIKKLHLFSEIPDKQLEEIAAISSVRKLKKGEIIFLEKDEYTGFFCIIEGIVKVYKVSAEGKERIIHLMYNNDTFAEVPVFENYRKIIQNRAKYPANATCLCDGARIVHIPAIPFLELMKSNQVLCIGMLSGLSKKLRKMQNQVMNVKSQDVTKRLANYIVSEYNSRRSIAEVNGKNNTSKNSFSLSISKIDLSSYLGATLETVSRTFKKLHTENYISIKGKNITIKDYTGLLKIINR
jgi:CRP/FNR family transcriptional regulator